ncbi:MAG: hypothetical protein DME76_20075 [Verrucomicrobia bacterium]|nr:MAG: hypothetical protein DME76_20075 [Verrucomicrobiota bacterium]
MSVYIFVCQPQSASVPPRTAAWQKWRSKPILHCRKCSIGPSKTSDAVCSLSELIWPYSKLRQNKKAWKAWQAELRQLDATLNDGI